MLYICYFYDTPNPRIISDRPLRLKMIELTQTTQRISAELGFKLGLSVQVLAFSHSTETTSHYCQ